MPASEKSFHPHILTAGLPAQTRFAHAHPLMAPAANYTASQEVVDGEEVVRLGDAARGVEVSIARTIGNNAYAMKVQGRSILRTPPNLGQLRQQPVFFGIPFMGPWANRLEQDAYQVNGRRYLLDPHLGNFLRDGNGLPIHGLLTCSPDWELVSLEADDVSARSVCRLEFGRHPALMAQFPFAHTLVMTHRLQQGVLEVETQLENQAAEWLPVSLGYHPYFQLPESPRDSWRVRLAGGDEILLSEKYLPTGETRPLQLPDSVLLAGLPSSHVLCNLQRGADGGAEFWVEGGEGRITMIQGPNYPVDVVYAPPNQRYVCFEPMAATINALNPLPHGRRPELPGVPPGGRWRESFWIQYAPS